MNSENFMKAMEEAMKRTEDRFVESGFADYHIENTGTGISHFRFNKNGIILSDLVRRFFNRQNTPDKPIPMEDCIAFIHLLIPPYRRQESAMAAIIVASDFLRFTVPPMPPNKSPEPSAVGFYTVLQK
jgi:hypothetical protein